MIAPPGQRLAARSKITRADLSGEAFLFREPGSDETIEQAVMAGLGIALVSAHTIAAKFIDGRLVVLDVDGLPVLRQGFILNHADRPLSPVGLALRDFAERSGDEFLPGMGEIQNAIRL